MQLKQITNLSQIIDQVNFHISLLLLQINSLEEIRYTMKSGYQINNIVETQVIYQVESKIKDQIKEFYV
jgi:hypothetical protein